MSIEKLIEENTLALRELTKVMLAVITVAKLPSPEEKPRTISGGSGGSNSATSPAPEEKPKATPKPATKAAAEEKEAEPAATREQVVAACIAAQQRVGKQPVKDVYEAFGATKTSELHEKQYPAVIAKLEALQPVDDLEA